MTKSKRNWINEWERTVMKSYAEELLKTSVPEKFARLERLIADLKTKEPPDFQAWFETVYGMDGSLTLFADKSLYWLNRAVALDAWQAQQAIATKKAEKV